MSKAVEEIKHEGKLKGVLIPIEVLFNDDLFYVDKIIFSWIISFESHNKTCFQTSLTIAKKLNLAPGQVRKSLIKLVKLGYIKKEQEDHLVKLPIVTIKKTTKNEVCQEDFSTYQDDTEVYHGDTPEGQDDTRSGHGDTHKNNINNNINNNIKNNTNTAAVAAETKDLNPNSENKDPKTKESQATKETNTASPKVAAKGVPGKLARPDTEDSSLKVLMTDAEWSKFQAQVGAECAYWWCSQLEDYATAQPKKFNAYASHYKTLLKWHQKRCADGLVFGWTPQGGNGFYKHWVNGLKVGGKNG